MAAGGTPSVDDPRFWSDDSGIPWVSISDMTWQPAVRRTERHLTKTGILSKRLPVGRKGTVLFAMYASVGAVSILDTDASWNQAVLGMEPIASVAEHRFLVYWLLSLRPRLKEFFRSNTQDNLNAEQVGNLPYPVLSVERQCAIADFLDAETARIDVLIAKKREQSRLVDLRWIALVTDLVRGRHLASASRWGSGVDWIGELPEEWGTPSVSMKFDVELGKMLNQQAAEGEDQRPYLRNQNVQWDSFDLEDVATMHFEPDEHARFAIRRGDLLVCEGGDVGRAAMWSSDADIRYQKALHRVRPRTDAPPRFLMYVLWAASLLGVFTIEGNQSTIMHLTREQFRAHRIPWPSVERQRLIVTELDTARAKMHEIQGKWARQISLLVEHRQALITAAVTGEIEVPEVAVPQA